MSAGNDEADTRAALDPALEPWTLRNGLQCDCHAWGYMCDQGRRCPHRPAPAEAATEVGADKDDDALDPILQGALEGLALGVWMVVIGLVIGLVAGAVVAPALQMLP